MDLQIFTSILLSIHILTIKYPGSDISGVPASEIRPTLMPDWI